mmetsp:Transcript_456/g.593  ORF Transcript_456/g.593 Transcript_456/m.593 type:complete len:425 (-) Transcript_456:128-1402(-)
MRYSFIVLAYYFFLASRCWAHQASTRRSSEEYISIASIAKLTLWCSNLDYMSTTKILSFENAVANFLSSSIPECNGSITIAESSLSARVLSQTMETHYQHHELKEGMDEGQLVVHVQVNAAVGGYSSDVNLSLGSIIGCYFNNDNLDGFGRALSTSSLLFSGCCDHSNMRASVASNPSIEKIAKEEESSSSGGFDRDLVLSALGFGVILAASIIAGYVLFRRTKYSTQQTVTTESENDEKFLHSDVKSESNSGAMSMIDLDDSRYGFSLFAEEPYCWMIERYKNTPKKGTVNNALLPETTNDKEASDKKSSTNSVRNCQNVHVLVENFEGNCHESPDLYNKQITFRAPPGPLGICISLPIHGRIPFIEKIKPSSPLKEVAHQFDSLVMIDHWDLKGASLAEIAEYLKERQHQTRMITILRRPEV